MQTLFGLKITALSLTKLSSWIPVFFCSALLSIDTDNKGYQFECLDVGDGFLELKIWSSDKKDGYKLEQARKDAVHAILFSGIPDNNQCTRQLPLLSKPEYQDKFTSIEKEFFAAKGKWSVYTNSSETNMIVPESGSKRNWKIYKVNVSRNELRKYLEEMKIIPPLNNGF